MRSRQRLARRCFRNSWVYLAAMVYAIFLLGPIVAVVWGSLLPESALISPTWTWDSAIGRITVDNYTYIFTGELPADKQGELRSRITQEIRLLPKALGNSLVVSFGAAMMCLLIGLPAAYAFVFRKFKLKEGVFLYLMLTRLLPPVTIVIPIFLIVKSVGLIDTKLGLVLVYVALILPLAIFFFRSYLARVPRELCEAAMIDGCSEWQAFFKIVIPVARGGIVAGALFSFFMAYVDFLFALVLTQTYGSKTMPVVLGAMAGNPDLDYSMLCAGVVLAIVPTVIIGLIIRNFLVESLIYHEK